MSGLTRSIEPWLRSPPQETACRAFMRSGSKRTSTIAGMVMSHLGGHVGSKTRLSQPTHAHTHTHPRTQTHRETQNFSLSVSGERLLLCLLHDLREAGRGVTQREQALLAHGDLQLSLQLRLEAAEALRKSTNSEHHTACFMFVAACVQKAVAEKLSRPSTRSRHSCSPVNAARIGRVASAVMSCVARQVL